MNDPFQTSCQVYLDVCDSKIAYISPKEALKNLDGLRKRHRAYHFADIVKGLTRQVSKTHPVQEKFRNIPSSTLRWHSMVTTHRHLDTFANLWRGQTSNHNRQLQADGKRYIATKYFDEIEGFRDIPSALRELPILTIMGFVAWACMEDRCPDCQDETTMFSLVRQFLTEILQDLTRLFDWKIDPKWDTEEFLEDSMTILTCFIDTLPFAVSRNNMGDSVQDGLRQEVARGDRFSPPSEESCLYHEFQPGWIKSMKSLLDPSPELLAVMDDYILSWEICCKHGNAEEQSAEAYRGCLIDDAAMIRCVALQAILLSFYKSIIPIVDLILSDTDDGCDPVFALNSSLRRFLFSTLQAAVLLHSSGDKYCTPHQSWFMSLAKDDDDGSSASDD